MRCSDAERLIQLEIAGKLSFWRRLALKWHIRGCVECASDLDFHRALESDLVRLRGGLAARQRRRVRRRRTRLVMGGFALVAGAVFVTRPDPETVSLQRMETALGEVRSAHVLIYDLKPENGRAKPRLEIWHEGDRTVTIDNSKPIEAADGETESLYPSLLKALGAADQGSAETWALPKPGAFLGFAQAGPPNRIVVHMEPTGGGKADAGSIVFETDPKTGLPLRARIVGRGGEGETIGWVRFRFDEPAPSPAIEAALSR